MTLYETCSRLVRSNGTNSSRTHLELFAFMANPFVCKHLIFYLVRLVVRAVPSKTNELEGVPNSVAGWDGGLSSYYATFSL